MLVFCVCITFLFFRVYSDLVIRKYEREQSQMLTYLKSSFQETLIGINQIAVATAQNGHIISQIQSYSSEQPAAERMVFFDNMTKDLQVIANIRPDIVSVNILTDKIRGYNSKVNGIYRYQDYFVSEKSRQAIESRTDCWLPTRPNDTTLTIYEKHIITYARRMYTNLFNGYAIGHVVINFKEDMLYDVIKDFQISPQQTSILVIDSSYNILTSNDRSLPGMRLSGSPYGYLLPILREQLSSGDKMDYIIPQQKLITAYHIASVDWTLIAVSDYRTILQPVRQLNGNVIGVCVFIIIVFLLLSNIVSDQISRPIREFARYVKLYQHDGHSSPPARKQQRIREIDMLYYRFDRMTDRIDELIRELYRKENQKKRAELEILQAQINPHFLYNTLDSINWMALLAKQGDVSKMVILLGNFLRLSLNKGKNVYQVRDELEHLKCYMEIQSIRYSGRIHYQIDVDDGLPELYMAKLILQPIVENCVLHAFEQSARSGNIAIEARDCGEDMVFRITDDGCGIPPELLARLRQPDCGASYGLRNVGQRIKMYYGDAYGLDISSEPGAGTTVAITLPKRYRDFESDGEDAGS